SHTPWLIAGPGELFYSAMRLPRRSGENWRDTSISKSPMSASRLAFAPSEWACSFVNPAVLRGHLTGALQPVTKKRNEDQHDRVHGKVIRRQQRLFKQRIVEEAHGH